MIEDGIYREWFVERPEPGADPGNPEPPPGRCRCGALVWLGAGTEQTFAGIIPVEGPGGTRVYANDPVLAWRDEGGGYHVCEFQPEPEALETPTNTG